LGTTVRLGVLGDGGVVGRRVVELLRDADHEVVPVARGDDGVGLDAVAVAAPWTASGALGPNVPAAGLDLGAATLPVGGPPRVPHAGWWGGLGSLLAAHALGAAADPREVHVAYALPGTARAWARLPAGARTGLVELLLGGPLRARVDGQLVQEPVGEARRLAWFPRPVGPWHAAGVPGAEALVVQDPRPDVVRSWLAIGSLAAEALQAVARLDPDRGLGARLHARAGSGGGDPGDVRWAVVAEVRDGGAGVLRAWANGTDPVRTAAALLADTTTRLPDALPGTTTLPGLRSTQAQLDALADAAVLRWSLARPEPSQR